MFTWCKGAARGMLAGSEGPSQPGDRLAHGALKVSPALQGLDRKKTTVTHSEVVRARPATSPLLGPAHAPALPYGALRPLQMLLFTGLRVTSVQRKEQKSGGFFRKRTGSA